MLDLSRVFFILMANVKRHYLIHDNSSVNHLFNLTIQNKNNRYVKFNVSHILQTPQGGPSIKNSPQESGGEFGKNWPNLATLANQ